MIKKKKKKYFYVISFYGVSENQNGPGCAQLYRDKKIVTIEDFNKVLEYLKEFNKLQKIIIYNIMLMGKVRV